jgi:hypothetical protein
VQALKRQRRKKLRQDAILPHADDFVHGVVDPQGLVAAPVVPAAGSQLVVQLWRETKRLVAEYLLLDQRQRSTLLLGRHNNEWRAAVRVALVIAVDVDAPYIARGEVHCLAVVAQQHAKGLPRPLVAIAIGGDTRHQVGP